MNRTTIMSIIATSIIIGLSIGMTAYLNPSKVSNFKTHRDNIIEDSNMKEMCNNFKRMMNQSSIESGKNNVIAYNLQRLHGQCYIQVGDKKKPIELLKLNGCNHDTNSQLSWELKKDSSIFDFCKKLEISAKIS